MNESPPTEELLQFPCQIDVKVMGRAEAGFTALVVEIVKRHAPDLAEDAVSTRNSRHGNFVSVTVRVQAQSREQMDAMYRELTSHEKVSVAL